MAYTCFDLELANGVAQLRLNRPDKLNTMIREFWSELPTAVHELDAGGSVRALVLSSTGKHFSAGMDLAVFGGGGPSTRSNAPKELGRQREALRRNVLELQDSFTAFERARMPVLAAIQGGCIGGALDMICACDMRYCTEDAFFCIQEINIGMTADVGTLQRLPRLIPSGMVRELAYTGRRLDARRAKELGLVNEVYPTHAALLDAVMQVATEIAKRSPLAVHGSKEMLLYARDHAVADSLNYMAAWQSGMYQPADMIESFNAKREQREPVFDDLGPHTKFSE